MRKLVVCGVLACTGCFGRPSELGSWGSEARSTCFYTDNGVFRLRVAEQRRNGQDYLVLLVAGGEPVRVGGGPHGTGRFKCADGRDVDWTCDTRDGLTGKLVIGDRAFRLEDGGLLLVDLRGGQIAVDQVAVDMRQFDSDVSTVDPQLFNAGVTYEQLKSLAETDPRVARFIKACESLK